MAVPSGLLVVAWGMPERTVVTPKLAEREEKSSARAEGHAEASAAEATRQRRFMGVWSGLRPAASGEEILDDLGWFDAGEAEVEALEAVGEAVVLDAHEVEGGGVEVADVDGVLDDVV